MKVLPTLRALERQTNGWTGTIQLELDDQSILEASILVCCGGGDGGGDSISLVLRFRTQIHHKISLSN